MTETMSIASTILVRAFHPALFSSAFQSWKNRNTGGPLLFWGPKNGSKANRLYITLDEMTDTYTMRFFRYTAPRMNTKTFTFTSEKVKEIHEVSGVYFDQLQPIFTSVTGFDTHL